MSDLDNKPAYYAIIHAEIRYSDKLSSSEKLLFAEITALTNKTGECWASNNYFAKLFDVDPSTVSKWISSLNKHDFIKVRYDKDGKQIKKRFISIIRGNENFQHPIENNHRGIEKRHKPLLKKGKGGSEKKPRYNNTSHNNTRKTTTKNNTPEVSSKMKKVIDRWNETFDIKVDIHDAVLVENIRAAVDEHSLDNLYQAIKFRSLSKFYSEQKPYLRDNPKIFFEYPQTIKNDMQRYPYKLITHDKRNKIESINFSRGGKEKDMKFEKDPDKTDDQGRPMWRYYE